MKGTNISDLLFFKWLWVVGLFFFSVTVEGQSGIDDQYLKITPGISTRENVERLFGKPKENGFVVYYKLDGTVVRIEYSEGRCRLNLGWDKLPEWTVQSVSYSWYDSETVRLSEVLKDQKKFVRKRLGDVISHIYYIDEDDGITIVFDTKNKTVVTVDIEPTRKMKEEFSCSTKGVRD